MGLVGVQVSGSVRPSGFGWPAEAAWGGSSDVVQDFNDRVTAVEIATNFQDGARAVLNNSAEATEACRLQVHVGGVQRAGGVEEWC